MSADGWQYLIRLGYSDEYDFWVAQILDDLNEELCLMQRDTINEAVGAAAAAIMDVEDQP